MKPTPNSLVEPHRVTNAGMFLASTVADGNNGVFSLPFGPKVRLSCIVSDGGGWEHVSVCAFQGQRERIPTWAEMCYVKQLFWGDDETVVQYHPATTEYVNLHLYVLHLWRPIGVSLPTPPIGFV